MDNKFKLRSESKPISGIFDINVESILFKMLCIQNDDTSVVDRVLNPSHFDSSLSQWHKWCKNSGIYIDIGAHTGLFTLVAMASNIKNKVLSFEPLTINYFRIISNLRLNNPEFHERAKVYNLALSDKNKDVEFSIPSSPSYLPKGGKIETQVQGIRTQAICLDKLNVDTNAKISAIKIDTEGEDLNVLIGGLNLLNKFKPKLIIETRKHNYNEIIKLLKNIGYQDIYTYDNHIKNKDLPLDFKGRNVMDVLAE